MACSCGGTCSDCSSGYQSGGTYRPQGIIRGRGSGRIDPTSPDRLPVDDVNAVLGEGEFVVNANAVDKVGVNFLNNVNNLGLGDKSSPIRPGTLGHGSKYQVGGPVNGRNKMRKKSRRRYQGGGHTGQSSGHSHSIPTHEHAYIRHNDASDWNYGEIT